MSRSRRTIASFPIVILITITLFASMLFIGPVDIPVKNVIDVILGKETDTIATGIILESRLPMALTALLAGASLSVAGAMMQTLFRNPLAGPSILGVSSGASLGVAVVMMGSVGLASTGNIGSYWAQLLGAICGSMIVILLISAFSSSVKNGIMLLIIGVMIGYLASSAMSLLNYIATAERLKNFTVWGLGSFSGVTKSTLPFYSIGILIPAIAAMLCVKPLDALLLGERYAKSMGYNIRRTRTTLLLISGILTASVTAFCGPIGFIGLIVPHIVRVGFGCSTHRILLPASFIVGGAVALLCALLSCIIADTQVPINVITPILGVPVIIFLILNRRKLPYFN